MHVVCLILGMHMRSPCHKLLLQDAVLLTLCKRYKSIVAEQALLCRHPPSLNAL